MTRHRGRRFSMRRPGIVAALIAAVIYGLGCGAAAAQTYPDRPIKLVVPFGAGGPPDVAARIIADYLSAHLGPIFIENRPGAGGTIAAKAVAAAPPDGYTLMLATSGALSISAQLYRDAGYDPVTSFAPIALISTAPLVLAVNAQLPIHTIPDLVAYAKSNPGKLNFGASIGTPPHISGEMFKVLTGTNIIFVPYKTAAAAASDTIAGQNPDHLPGHDRDHAVHPNGQAQADRRRQPRAHPGIARCADHGGAGDHRHAARCLARHRRAGRDARGDHRQAQPRDQRGAHESSAESRHHQAGRQPEADHPCRIRVLHRDYEGGMGEGDQGHRRYDQLS